MTGVKSIVSVVDAGYMHDATIVVKFVPSVETVTVYPLATSVAVGSVTTMPEIMAEAPRST